MLLHVYTGVTCIDSCSLTNYQVGNPLQNDLTIAIQVVYSANMWKKKCKNIGTAIIYLPTQILYFIISFVPKYSKIYYFDYN